LNGVDSKHGVLMGFKHEQWWFNGDLIMKNDDFNGICIYIYTYIMWVKQCHKPPIWEWFIPPIKMVIWGMVYYCFTHIT
jgi:hypothetical protein